MYLQALLDHEEGRVVLQRPAGMYELKLVPPQQVRKQLVDLQQCQIPADAEMASSAELTRESVCEQNSFC